jgi:diguanylate cyclase (GGDEF)-like protein
MVSPHGEAHHDIDPSAASPGAAIQAALIDSLDCAVIACDGGRRLLYANGAAAMLWDIEDWEAEPDAAMLFPFRACDGGELDPGRHPLIRAQAGEHLRGERFTVVSGAGLVQRVHVSARPLEGAGTEGAVVEVSLQHESDADAELRTHVSDFEILSEVSRQLADVSDAEEAASIVCTVAAGCTGAMAVFLWERQGDGLILRGQEGLVSGEALAKFTEHARAGASRAVAEAAAQVENQGESGTSWHEPMRTRGRASGALSILWPGVLGDLTRPGWLIAELAHHAATALDRASLVRRLNAAARTDPLTGLANRRVWDERLGHELARARREGQPISLILIDLDRFKAYNDRFGHPQGDVLLREAAAALSVQLRTTDLFARIGGEEFAILLPSCPPEDACLVAERLRTAMPYHQTCSLGVTTWDGEASAFDLYAAADAALYRAKESGRNRFVVGHLPPLAGASVGA